MFEIITATFTLIGCLIMVGAVEIPLTICYVGLKEGITGLQMKLNDLTWLTEFVLMMIPGILYYGIETQILDWESSLCIVVFLTGLYGLVRKKEMWKENWSEFLFTHYLFVVTTVVVVFAWGIVSEKSERECTDTDRAIFKSLLCLYLWWPLIERSITNFGISIRLLLLLVLPMAYSDMKTSEAYTKSVVKAYIDKPVMLLGLWICLGVVIVHGVKGTIPNMKEQGLSFFKRLNYWAVLAIVVLCIVTQDSLPMHESQIPKEFHNIQKGPWYYQISAQLSSSDKKPIRTPIFYIFLKKYNFI